MNRTIPLLLIGIFFFNACENVFNTSKKNSVDFKKIPFSYPVTKKDTAIKDDFHGMTVADPYRWLEKETSTETKNWIKTQNQTTFSYLDQIPFRNVIEKRLQKIWNYERFSTPFKKGGKYYFFKNDGLQNQSVLYVQESLDGEPAIVLNPNTFSKDGTASMGGFSFSNKGTYLAYEISESGSDWRTIRIKDLKNDNILEDQLKWVKFSNIAWYKYGFYYSRYPEVADGGVLSNKNEFHQIFYHKLGTPQTDDELVFADRAHPNHGMFAHTSEDERYLIIGIWQSTSGNALYVKDLSINNSDFIPIIESFDFDFNFVDVVNNRLLLLTNYKADNNRLIAISPSHPMEGFWEDILSETEDKLASVNVIGGKIIANYTHNASSNIKVFDTKGNLDFELELPQIGTVQNFSGKKEEPLAFYAFTSITSPTTIYSLNLETKENKIFKQPKIDFDTDAYETKQVWYEGYDGTKIPMFVTHKKGLELDGKRPTLLYGYGGFDISIPPQFNLTRLNLSTIFLENDGVFAIANIRGGGEFGKKWHEAGTKERKQNVFNDFQAAAEFLIDQKYTSNEKLAIYGRSNGGLLIGACLTQRPDLYKVALPAVGVLDMLRYDKFTIGRAWASDYGLSENEKDFDYLYAYSPLHNTKPAKYPATLITTADHDDRVVPAHSFKFAAALQENQKGKNPVFIRIETSAGHGSGKPTSKKIKEAADILSFTFYNLGENVVYDYKIPE
jgi:prolyl oligopeptidase